MTNYRLHFSVPALLAAALLLFGKVVSAQPPSEATLIDLSNRAMIQVSTIQGYLTKIAGAEEDLRTRERLLRACLELFSPDATVEEQGKRSGKRRWQVNKYLNTLMARGKRTPVIMGFKMLSTIEPKGLVEISNPDGSISYRGKLRFDQHYCKTNGTSEQVETRTTPNCIYEDFTEKEVTIDFTRTRSQKGVFWIIQISAIEVILVR